MPNILQLTDLHLMSDPTSELKGRRVREITMRVLNEVKQQIASERLHVDQIVITGDLAHDEARETYVLLRETLGDLYARCRLLPGNHDSRPFMREVFPELFAPDDEYLTFSVAFDGWRMIGLDTHVPGQVHGHLAAAQVRWLKRVLSEHADQPTILFLHHPPFRVGAEWVDALALQNADELMECLDSAPHVKAISAGHVHQEYSAESQNVRLFTTPSASLQFIPGAKDLELDTRPPGFRLFQLGDKLESRIVRLP